MDQHKNLYVQEMSGGAEPNVDVFDFISESNLVVEEIVQEQNSKLLYKLLKS